MENRLVNKENLAYSREDLQKVSEENKKVLIEITSPQNWVDVNTEDNSEVKTIDNE
jgi:hypothetical protein